LEELDFVLAKESKFSHSALALSLSLSLSLDSSVLERIESD
jgi:hypothetical protein